MPVSSWSTTAGNNTPPEGCLPGVVNDEIRAMRADLRAAFNNLPYFVYGDGDGGVTFLYVSATAFKVAGDHRTKYHISRRFRATGSTTGTVTGQIALAPIFDGSFTVVTTENDNAAALGADANLTIELGTEAPPDVPSFPDASNAVKGAIEIATRGEFLAGTSGLLAVVPGNFNDHDLTGTSWYYKLPSDPDPMIFQGGVCEDGQTITFPVAFTAIRWLNISLATSSTFRACHATNITLSNFTASVKSMSVFGSNIVYTTDGSPATWLAWGICNL